jgi:hypothetical protein
VVRPRGQTTGGVGIVWPNGTDSQQADYNELVVGDPIASARELSDTGDVQGAIDELKRDLGRLDAVFQYVDMHADKFTDQNARSEMLSRIGERETQIRAEIRSLTATLPAAPAASPADAGETSGPTPAQIAVDDEEARARAEADAAREERNARLDKLVPTCLNNREHEREVFQEVDAEYHKWLSNADPTVIFPLLNDLRDNFYPRWDEQVDQIREVFKERGDPPEHADQYAPDRAGWNARNRKALEP